eukprot:jgi/Mesvir1/18676/Mv25671-RA.1
MMARGRGQPHCAREHSGQDPAPRGLSACAEPTTVAVLVVSSHEAWCHSDQRAKATNAVCTG